MLAQGIGSIDELRFQEKVFQYDKEKKSYYAIWFFLYQDIEWLDSCLYW